MADDKEIGIEANLNQPVAEMAKLQSKLGEVEKGVKNVVKQMELLRDIKVGAVTTANFDKTQKEILQNFRNLITLVNNENPGAAISKALVDGMTKGIKANMTSFGRQLTDATLSTFKDAERQIKNSTLLKFLENENKGARRFVNTIGTDPADEKRLELKTRIRAAEMLLAAAEEQNARNADGSLNRIVAKRERELRLLTDTQLMLDKQTSELQKQERLAANAEAAANRRANAAARRNIIPAARLSVQETIEQTTGFVRPDVDKTLANMRVFYDNLAQKQAAIIQASKDKIAATLAKNNIYRAARITTQETIDQSVGITKLPNDAKAIQNMKDYYQKLSDKKVEISTAAAAVADAKIALITARRNQQNNFDPSKTAELSRAAAEAQNAYQAAVAKSQQDIQRLRLFGDGGQFLLEIQSRLMLNYKVLTSFFGAISYGIRSVVEFDEALHQLQAISGSTKGEMKDLKEVIVGVAEGSRYTATAVTQAAVVLAQAGLSMQQIGAALKPITMLAQATGSELKTSVDVVTSVLGAFNYRAEETGQIVNIMAGALNTSKLDMEKLALGIQYSGNTAAQANVSFAELTGVLSALSNTGVRSGSTLGTGVTQLISDLLNPTDKLKEVLAAVGLTIGDVDIRTKGLTPTLEKMANAGFGASQAFEGLELRGARAYLGLLSQVDGLQQLTQANITSQAAMTGSRVAMDSIAAASNRVQANFGIMADKMGEDFKPKAVAVMNTTADLISSFGGLIQTIVSLGTTVAGTAAVYILATQFARLLPVIGSISAAFLTYSAAARTASVQTDVFGVAVGRATVAATGFGRALSILRGIGPLALAFIGFEVVSAIMSMNANSTSKFAEAMDKLKQKTNEATQANTKQVDTQMAIDKAINDLLSKYTSLNENSGALATETLNLKTRFADLGLELPKTVTNVNELVAALEKLRNTSRGMQTLSLNDKIGALKAEREAFEKRAAELSSENSLNTLIQNDSKTPASVRREMANQFRQNRFKEGSQDSQARGALENIKGVMPETKSLMDSMIGNDVDKTIAQIAKAEQALDRLKKLKDSDVANPGDTFTNEDNRNLGNLILKRAREWAADELEKRSKGRELESTTGQRDELLELQNTIYSTMENAVNASRVHITEMRDKLKSAPVGDKKGIADEMQKEVSEVRNFIDGMFQQYLSTLSGEQKRVAELAYKKNIERGLNETTGLVTGDVNAAREEVDKVQKARLQSEMKTIQTQIETEKRRAKQYTDAGRIEQSNQELERLQAKYAETKERLFQKDRDALKTAQQADEKKDLIIQQEAELDADRAKFAEEAFERRKKASQDLVRMEIETSKVMVSSIQAQINSNMSALTGMLGRTMSKEQREKIFEQIATLTEQLISMQIRMIIASFTSSGQNLDDPEIIKQMQGQMDAVTTSGREALKGYRNRIDAKGMAGGQEELSRELKLMLADFEVELKKLAQNFRQIEKGLANANLAAENIQFKFDANLKAYDAPVNRNSFTTAFKEVEQFEKAAEIEQKVRQLKIDAAKIAVANQQTGMQKAEQLVGSLQKEKTALEGVAGGNNANTNALAAVSQKLQTAEGEMERYRQQIETTTEAIKRMEIEQQAQTQPKAKPTFFEQLNNGVKAWEIQNKLFQDGLTQIAERVPQMLNIVASGFSDAFVSMVDGTKSVGQAFGDMARSVVKALLQMMVQMVAMMALKMAFKALGMGLPMSTGGEVPDSSSVGGGTGGGYGTYRDGGNVRKRFAGGGQNRDSVNATLMPGEYVLRRSAARAIGRDTLDRINSLGNRKISEPMGAVGDFGTEMAEQRTTDRQRKQEGEQNVTNVWIVPQGQQPPPPSAKDIVAIVNSDIVRGGQTRVLIKSIVNGRG